MELTKVTEPWKLQPGDFSAFICGASDQKGLPRWNEFNYAKPIFLPPPRKLKGQSRAFYGIGNSVQQAFEPVSCSVVNIRILFETTKGESIILTKTYYFMVGTPVMWCLYIYGRGNHPCEGELLCQTAGTLTADTPFALHSAPREALFLFTSPPFLVALLSKQ